MRDTLNRLALESAIMGAKGDALLLELAAEDVLKQSNVVEQIYGHQGAAGYQLFYLNDAQVTAFTTRSVGCR
jgi:hypothetical protein